MMQQPTWTGSDLWQAAWMGALPLPLIVRPTSQRQINGQINSNMGIQELKDSAARMVLDSYHLKVRALRRSWQVASTLAKVGHVVVSASSSSSVTRIVSGQRQNM